MKRITDRLLVAAAALGLGVSTSALGLDITGAGATFPYPIYAKWAEAYKAKSGVGMNYQSIGSGGGIKQIQNKTVDFGASDMPLKPEDLDKDGLLQFPTVIGGDVPVVNLENVKPGELKLTGPVLADIYLGKIAKWNDPAIAKLNAGAKLPASEITDVHPDVQDAGEARHGQGSAQVLRLGLFIGWGQAGRLARLRPAPQFRYQPDQEHLEIADQGRVRQAGVLIGATKTRGVRELQAN